MATISRRKLDLPHLAFIAMLCAWGLTIVYPFYNSVLISIVPMSVYTKTPFLFYPKKLDFGSYIYAFTWKSIWNGAFVTLIVTAAGTVYNLLLTVSTAYALSKRIPGRKFFNYMIIFTLYFSGGLIPFYILISNQLGLINTVLAMILPTGINIVYMLIMRSYFYTIPAEIEESAKLDGANDILILYRIVLPLCLPMLATIGLYYAVDRWNEWWLGMLFSQRVNVMPLQLFIRNMLQNSSLISNNPRISEHIQIFPVGIQMACIVITTVPIICVYPFLQKYFVKGLVLGGVKA